MTHSSAAQRGADWLVSLTNDDGSIHGGSSINEYYKTVFGLCCAGRNAEADCMLSFIDRRFLRANGDLDGTGCGWFHLFPIYPHAWVLMAALMRGRLEMVHRLAEFLETFQDETTGGLYTTPGERQRQGQQDMMTTGLVAIALLWAGRLDVARRTAGWMRQLWDAQPDLTRKLYFISNHCQVLVRDFPETDAKAYVVDATQEAQRYYQFGIPCAFLTQYGAATGDRTWHKLAGDYLHATGHYHHDVYQRPQSGKVGWAAAWRYRLLREPADLEILRKVHDHLVAAQHPQGWWSAASVYQPQSQSSDAARPAAVEPGIDLTGEFVAHLSWMESALNAAELCHA